MKSCIFCSNQKGGVGEVSVTYAGDLLADYKNSSIDESKCSASYTASVSTGHVIKF